MIASIRLNGKFNINTTGKIQVGDNVLNVEKDIPFVRYRLPKYDVEEVEYIKDMQSKFPKSTHLVELELNDYTSVSFNLLRENLSVAVYLYTDITEDIVKSGELPDDMLNRLRELANCKFDRFMLRDKSVSLDFMLAQKFMNQVAKTVRVKVSEVGICSSPLSFQGLQCLSAVKARELMSIYNENIDVPLPSANHECMNCCGCIRYFEVNEDLKAPSVTESKKSDSNKKAKPKPKSTYIPGRFSF